MDRVLLADVRGHDVQAAIAVHVAHRHTARLVAAGSVPGAPRKAGPVVPVDCVRPAVAVGEHEVEITVAVQIRGCDIDRGVVPRPEGYSGAEGPGPVVVKDEVPPSPVHHQNVRVSVAVQVRQRQASRRTRDPEGAAGLEAASAVVEEDEVSGAVVPHGNVQVPVAIEIGERGRVGAGQLLPQPPREGEGAPPVVEVDPVLPRPVAAVGDHRVQRPVSVHVAQAHRSRQFAARTQRPERAEGPLLLRGQRAHGEVAEEGRDGEEGHRAKARAGGIDAPALGFVSFCRSHQYLRPVRLGRARSHAHQAVDLGLCRIVVDLASDRLDRHLWSPPTYWHALDASNVAALNPHRHPDPVSKPQM